MMFTRMPVALFGGGHVGRAIVRALEPLPVRVHWIDSRDEIFPADVPANVSSLLKLTGVSMPGSVTGANVDGRTVAVS